MEIFDYADLEDAERDAVVAETAEIDSLVAVLNRMGRLAIADVVAQDEYTNDIVVPWDDGLVLVYDTT